MKILIVDDEALAQDRLERLLKEQKIESLFRASSADEALEIFKRHMRTTPFNLVFLDINMAGESGLELGWKFKEIYPYVQIIFQTAYTEHMQEAFELGAIDYILKPIKEEDIQRILIRIRQLYTFPKNHDVIFTAKLGDTIYLLKPEEIVYIKADLDEVKVRTVEKEYYVSKKMHEMEEILTLYGFFRAHRSLLVNLHKIKSLETVEQSKFEISFHEVPEHVTSSKDGAKLLRAHLNYLSGGWMEQD